MSIDVSFTDASKPGPSGPITAWAWDFGDTGTSSAQNPTHTYATDGRYTVSLTVTGTSPDGTDNITRSVQVGVGGALTAAFTDSVVGLAVTFTDTSAAGPSGPITAWAWDFGDGATSTSQNPVHTYAAAGTYTVTLTVTGTGADGTDTAHGTVITSGGVDFISVTSWSRPAFTPTRTVNFTNLSQLNAAITNMAAGDLIQYTGTGVLNISSASTTAFKLTNKNPASTVVIDFGTAQSIWDPGAESGDYVKFAYTGSSNINAFAIAGCSKLRIYGGEIASPIGGAGMIVNALTHDVLWYDGYISSCGGSGIGVRGATSGGVTSNCYNLDLRFEVNRFCMNPAWDNHADKGTGFHALILHGNTGGIHDSRFVIYGHDPLRPGETSAGKTWPEGGGGSVIEQGNATAANYDDVTMYALGVNCLMVPNGSNPGSTAKQTGGNVFDLWGHIKLNGNVIGWAEGRNMTGSIIHSDNGSWFPGSPPLTVQHGRHTHTNQSTVGGNIAAPYPTTTPLGATLGIVYNDCT